MKTRLEPDQIDDLKWFFDNELETAAGNKRPFGIQLDRAWQGVNGDGNRGGAGNRTEQMDQAYRAVRRQRKVRTILGAVPNELAVVLRAVYRRGPTAALNELVPQFGDQAVARIAIERCELPAPGASGLRVLSQLVKKARDGDKDARRALSELRSGIESAIAEAELAYIKSERLWRLERREARRQAKLRREALFEESLA